MAGSLRWGQIEPQGQIGLQQRRVRVLARCLHPSFESRQDPGVESLAAALVGERRIAEAVAQHHLATPERRADDLADMVAPRRKHQQGLGQSVHWRMEHQGTQLFRQWRSAGLARHRHHPAACLQGLRQCLHVTGLAGPIDAFERDENASLCHATITCAEIC